MGEEGGQVGWNRLGLGYDVGEGMALHARPTAWQRAKEKRRLPDWSPPPARPPQATHPDLMQGKLAALAKRIPYLLPGRLPSKHCAPPKAKARYSTSMMRNDGGTGRDVMEWDGRMALVALGFEPNAYPSSNLISCIPYSRADTKVWGIR